MDSSECNNGSRDMQEERVFGGWIAAFSDHIVSITTASVLEDGEWFTTTQLTTRIFSPRARWGYLNRRTPS
jgi:acyl-coenzyme A thioesterase PaaI-like protein